MKMKNIGYFEAGDKPDGKFAALYDDGSGALLAIPIDKEDGTTIYLCADYDEVEYEWFIDAGFLLWVRIPDNYKLWCEREEEE